MAVNLTDVPIKLATDEVVTPRQAAYVGDAVYELLVRQLACQVVADQTEAFHRWVVARVCADYQACLLQALTQELTDTERDWVRRGRNLPIPKQRRQQHQVYRAATGFEVLVGYWFAAQPERLPWLLERVAALQPNSDVANT